MSEQIEALKLALEALEYPINQSHENFNVDMAELLAHRAITAIEEALMSVPDGAQPAQKQCDNCGEFGECCQAQPAVTPSHKQEPAAWKLVPVEPTKEMLKAMDECSTEGYDERLYAGHAASVYMAAVDVAPTPPQRKPLTDEEFRAILRSLSRQQGWDGDGWDLALKEAIEAAHGIKGEA